MLKSTKKIKVKADESKQRLDVFLTAKLAGFSRAAIQKLVVAKQILVNEKPANKHYKLKTDDLVEIKPEKIKKILEPAKIKERLPEIKIMKETKDFVVVNKPAGLVVHADSAHSLKNTLIGQVLDIYPEIKKVGDNPLRPGVVHRLDKDVSGIIVIARNQAMFDHLKSEFQARKVDKEYLALTHGVINKEKDEISFPISRKKSGFMAANPQGSNGREAVTKIKSAKIFLHYTLIKVLLITGRTHQIRVHLSAYGHPIVGEKIYISKKPKKTKIQGELDRLFLHASKLGFTDLTGAKKEFYSDLPKELSSLLEKLK